MITKTYTIPNISCGHCTATIERELSSLHDLEKFSANLETKQVIVQAGNEDTLREVESILVEIGYPPNP